MQHYQSVLRLDTRNPPGNEHIIAEYVKQVLEKEGIPAQIVGSDPKRSNVVARLKGSGRKRPLLIMGHSDVVTVDEAKWKFPPFSATRDGGYVYGRGTVDDKDNLTASLMTMLLLKRLNVALDRDVIFLSESGEEGSTGGLASGGPTNLTDVGGTAYFSASNGNDGNELFRSDGTASGTTEVKDINPGPVDSNPSYLTNVAGTLLFAADDGTNGTELWRSIP